MATVSSRELILASSSTRRRDLLAGAGVRFRVLPAQIDESTFAKEHPEALTRRLASAKAAEVAEKNPASFVLGADTVVAVEHRAAHDGAGKFEILGKPQDRADAVRMLQLLQNRSHVVCSGFCLMCHESGEAWTKAVSSQVWFNAMSEEDIAAYVESGEPMDKAGAYAIQGLGGCFIPKIEGSYTAVVGLPLPEVLGVLRGVGLWEPQQRKRPAKKQLL